MGKLAARLLQVGMVTALLAVAGCVSRPTGDFGRADPSFTHDTAMPIAGKLFASARKEPVSWLNQTDQEAEMQNRVWRFLVAEHTNDWFYNIAVELQRTRILPAVDDKFSTDIYYNWLKQTQYQSSTARYGTVGADVTADTDTAPGTFIAICKVKEIDRQRRIAGEGLASIEADMRASVDARKSENDTAIGWFVRALTYRYQSYNYALDHLLVETPDPASIGVDRKLQALKVYVDRASRGDFCANGTGGTVAASDIGIPSRFTRPPYVDNEVIALK